MLKRFLCLAATAAMLMSLTACNGDKSKENRGNVLDITGTFPGDIFAEFEFLGYSETATAKLFPELAPIAVEQFVTRAERGFFEGKNIHRVIPGFIFQGGSINFDGTDGAVEEREFFEVETSPHARNFYGALAMASDSRGRNYCQFYVVTNKEPVDIAFQIEEAHELLSDNVRPLNDPARKRIQSSLDVMNAIPENIRQLYLTRGGAPSLDGNNTVFGQFISGMDLIDAIANVPVVAGNALDDERNVQSRPLDEIIIKSVTIIRIPLPAEEEEPEETSPPRRGAGTPPPTAPDLTEKINLTEPPPAPTPIEPTPEPTPADGENAEDGEPAVTPENDETNDEPSVEITDPVIQTGDGG
jgi:cyclophilin family peptidyl-prolyl cis-trans isomerase